MKMDVTIGSVVILFTAVLLGGCDTTSILNPCRLTRCPRGQLLDIASCRCTLVRQLPVNPNLVCPNLFCPLAIYPCTSYKTDLRGCKTCECRCVTTVCPHHCRYGTENSTDRNGCQVCKCKSQKGVHVCPNEPCAAFCLNGLQVDEFGCQLCRCKPKKCGILCRNFCPNGREVNADGCPSCTCKNNPGRPLITY